MFNKKEYMRKYRQSETGKKTIREYRQSEKGKKTIRKYNQSEKGKKTIRKYIQSEKGKKTRREYEQSEKGKKAIRKYNQTGKGRLNSFKCAAKRRRGLGFNITFELSLDVPSVWHHFTNQHVIQIPEFEHLKYGGKQENHRELILLKILPLYYSDEELSVVYEILSVN